MESKEPPIVESEKQSELKEVASQDKHDEKMEVDEPTSEIQPESAVESKGQVPVQDKESKIATEEAKAKDKPEEEVKDDKKTSNTTSTAIGTFVMFIIPGCLKFNPD